MNKYTVVDLYLRLDGSIHLWQNFVTQIIVNLIPRLGKSSANPTPAVKPPLEKRGRSTNKILFYYRSVIILLEFLTNSIHPKAQFVVYQYARFRSYPKLPHNQAIKRIIKYLKGITTKGLIMKTDTEKGT